MRVVLNTPFKGSREYITGADMMNHIESAVRENIDPSANIKSLAMRNMATHLCELLTEDDEAQGDAEPVAKFTLEGDLGVVTGCLVESQQAVIDRVPYDEDQIAEDATIDGATITQTSKSSFSAIEEVVALTKVLHYDLLPDIEGKWIFVRLQMSDALSSYTESLFQIHIANKLGGRATVSDISVKGHKIGRIHFGVYNA